MNLWGPQTDFGLSSEEMLEEVSLHLVRHIGDYETAFTDVEGWAGRSREDGPPVDVLVVPPDGERRFAYVASFGCAFRPLPAPAYQTPGARRRVEFVLAAQQKGELEADREALNLAANTVRQFAKLVHLNPVTVEDGETVAFSENPEPVYPGSNLVAFAFAEPRIPGPGFPQMRLQNGETVRYIAPVPIYRDELDAAREHGPGALTDALSRAGVTEMLDFRRISVARPSPPARPPSLWTRLLSLVGIRPA